MSDHRRGRGAPLAHHHRFPEPSAKEVVHYLLHTTPGMHVCRSLGDGVEEGEHHLPAAPRLFRNVAGLVLNRRGDAVAGVVMHNGECFSMKERWSMPRDHSHHHHRRHVVHGRAEEEDGSDVPNAPPLRLHAPMVGGRLAVVTPASDADAEHLHQRVARAPPMSRADQQQLLSEIRAARQQVQAPPQQLSPEDEAARQDMLRQKALQMRIRMGQEYAIQQKQKEEEWSAHLADSTAFDRTRVSDLALSKQRETDAMNRLVHPLPGTAPLTPQEAAAAAAKEYARLQAANTKLSAEAAARLESARTQAEIAASSRAITQQHMDALEKDRLARGKRQTIDKTYAQRMDAYQTALALNAQKQPHVDLTTSHLPVYSSAVYNQNLVYVAPATFVTAIQKRNETPLSHSLAQRQIQTQHAVPLAQYDADLVPHDEDDL
jgi:hypothetical protein